MLAKQLSVVGCRLMVKQIWKRRLGAELFLIIFSTLNQNSLNSENKTTDNRQTDNRQLFLSGGTDLYVQRPEEMVCAEAESLFDNAELRKIEETQEFIEIGASVVVTDLLISPIFQNLFPKLYKHLKLVSSTPIRNMATLAGNFVNASPIGDMTAWFLALNAEIELETLANKGENPRFSKGAKRTIALKDFYLGYKQLAKNENEFISKIRFRKNLTHFNFEKVCKRTYLDIASVNTAISLKVENNFNKFRSRFGWRSCADSFVFGGNFGIFTQQASK